jgi:hypothetical protein
VTVGKATTRASRVSQATLQKSVRPCPDFLRKNIKFLRTRSSKFFGHGVEDAMLKDQEDRPDKELFCDEDDAQQLRQRLRQLEQTRSAAPNRWSIFCAEMKWDNSELARS